MQELPQLILPINKPPRLSSNHALNRVKRHLPRGTKIGHAGTLDPFATGVLVVLIGRGATRLSSQIMAQPKTYRATIKLGATTATLDPTSPEVSVAESIVPTLDQIQSILPLFTGIIHQVPPAFSALKRNGQPIYLMARKGKPVEVHPRPVMVYKIRLTRYAYPEIELEVHCGQGTYIRSLARDIAEKLGAVGYLTSLCRTAVGPYTLASTLTIDALKPDLFQDYLKPQLA